MTAALVSTSIGSGRVPPLDYVLEPARLPVNWTGFTSVRAVAIGKTEWDQLSDPQKNALVTWVACGGDLILVDGQVTDLLPSMPAETATQSGSHGRPPLLRPGARADIGGAADDRHDGRADGGGRLQESGVVAAGKRRARLGRD